MSRIGKQPIPVPAGVDVFIEPELVRVKGSRGELEERVARPRSRHSSGARSCMMPSSGMRTHVGRLFSS